MSWGFDFNEVKEQTNQVLPTGQYTVQIEKAEVKKTKAGDGEYLNVQMKVISQYYNGGVLFHMFNLRNPNEIAQNIGRSELKTLMGLVSVGDLNAAGPNDLVGKVIDVKTAVKVDRYGERAVVKKFLASTLNAIPVSNEEVPF